MGVGAGSRRTTLLARLIALERAAVAEEVASVLRHDLRNNIMAIRNAATYLSRKTKASELWQEDKRVPLFFELLDKEVARAQETITKRTNLDHLFEHELADISVGHCVGQALEIAALPESIRAEIRDQATGRVRADAEHLVLMTRCLVDNAVEAMPNGGSITLSVADADDAVTLRIQDSGNGFESGQDALRALYSTKAGHAGLGLNIARRIVKRFRGTLVIPSSPDGGVVEVVLPAATGGEDA